MSRVATIASMTGRNHAPRHNAPRPGTKLRLLYDMFQAHRGKVVQLSQADTNHNRRIVDLTDYYGLDIRNVKYGGHYMLVGEWIGGTYRDYLVEALKREEAK